MKWGIFTASCSTNCWQAGSLQVVVALIPGKIIIVAPNNAHSIGSAATRSTSIVGASSRLGSREFARQLRISGGQARVRSGPYLTDLEEISGAEDRIRGLSGWLG